MASEIIKGALRDIQKMRDATRKIAEASPDVKAGTCTVEDELQEPGYVLYSSILDIVAKYFEDANVQALCEKIGTQIGEGATADIMTLLSVGMAHASYNSILAYDTKLKNELSAQLQPIIDSCNQNAGDLQTFNGALQVFRSQLGEIAGKDKLDKLFRDHNLNVTKDKG